MRAPNHFKRRAIDPIAGCIGFARAQGATAVARTRASVVRGIVARSTVLGLASVAVAALGLMACTAAGARPGHRAPDFSVTTISGQHVSLATYRGKVLVLNFWATWCPPCIEETPSLNAMAQQLAGTSVRVLGISVDSDPDIYRRFLAQYKITFPTALDPDYSIPHRYSTVKIPETYIINQRGIVTRKIVSASDWTAPDMLQYLRDLAASGGRS
jgi:cytochrome c biogenesis protein CcmG/thiol:disulfide interchange protein DsbE